MRRIATYIILFFVSIAVNAQEKELTSLFLDAVTSYSQGDLESARKKFTLYLGMKPDDDAANYYLGLCEYSLGNGDNAERFLSKAVQADSTNEWYINALATYYNGKGDMFKAAEMCEKLIELRPGYFSNSYTLTLIGDAKFSARQDSLALKYYDQALEMEPEYAPAQLSKLEALRLTGKEIAFFGLLEQFINNMQVRPEIKSNYIKALMEHIDSKFYWLWGEQINRLVDLCASLHPDDLGIQNIKMQLIYIKDDMDAVIEQCRVIQEVAAKQGDVEKQVEALSMEGDIYYQRGERKKAFDVYNRVLKLKPDYSPVLNNYAYYLSEEKKSLSKALKMSKAAIDAEPDNATYLDTYAWILHLLGKDKEAKPHFKHAMLYGGKDSAVILEHYAIVLEALGETELAAYYQSLAKQKGGK